MIREIILDGEIMTADHWLEAGLPPCLHECLDGTLWLYNESREYFGEGWLGGSRWAIERMFRLPNIEDAVEPLKLAFRDYLNRQTEEKLRRGLPANWSGGNFLEDLIWDFVMALRPESPLDLTQKQIDDNLDAVNRAVRVLTGSPLNRNPLPNDAIYLVAQAIREKAGSSVVASNALYTLGRELDAAGLDISLGDLLDCWVKERPTGHVRGVSRPGRGDAAKRSFCISLADTFGWKTEKCIYREVAILATAVFSDTSEDYVRKAHQRAKT